MPERTVYDILSEAQTDATEALATLQKKYADARETHEKAKEALENGDLSSWDYQVSQTALRRLKADLDLTAHAERLIADALGAANKAPSLH